MANDELRRIGATLLNGPLAQRLRRTAAWRLARFRRSDQRLRQATGFGLSRHACGKIEFLTPPGAFTVGQRAALAVRVSSAADGIWPALGPDRVAIAVLWHNQEGRRLGPAEPSRSPLPSGLATGESAVAAVRVLAPPIPGRYRLRLTLVREGLAWFDLSAAFQVAETWVEVEAAPTVYARRVEHADDSAAAEAKVRRLLYQDWLERFERLHEHDLATLRSAIDRWEQPPTLWIVAVPGIQAAALEAMIASCEAQLYRHWRVLWAGPEPAPAIHAALLAVTDRDRRHRLAFGSGLTAALAEASERDLLLLLPRDGLLGYQAACFLAQASREKAEKAWFTGDEDRWHPTEGRFAPDFKVRGGEDLCLTSTAPLRPLTCRIGALRAAGGLALRGGLPDEQDLAFRLLERHGVPAQLAQVLCHRYEEDLLADQPGERDLALRDAGTAARRAYLARQGRRAVVEAHDDAVGWRLRYPLPDPPPRVTVIIPTRDRLDLLGPCLDGLWHRTDYGALDILVVDNASTEPATLDFLARHESLGHLRVLRYDGAFNWSAINNRAVAQCDSPIVCLLNNDTEVLDPQWLSEMVAYAQRPDVGVVGAGLWHAGDTLQHGGVVIGGQFCAQHWGKNLSAHARPHYLLRSVRQVSAVTGACMTLRREVFDAVGGFDAHALKVGLNDIDLCLRIARDLGLSSIWTPHARLRHYERASRGRKIEGAVLERIMHERSAFRSQHHEAIADDQHASPNLSFDGLNLATDPRAPLRQVARRQRLAGTTPLAFLHIPKTAGTALRHRLLSVYPGCGTFWLSARSLLLCYEGDAQALSEAQRRALQAQAWLSHFSQGFDRMIGVPAVYATVLRDPVSRLLSHHAHLVSGQDSPLRGSPLAKLGPGELLRRGVIPGNLMVRRLAGLRPEIASWRTVAGGAHPQSGGYCGFELPEGVWRGEIERLLDQPAIAPLDDEALLDRAMEAIERDYAFVACQEDLEAALCELGHHLGWSEGSLQRYNDSQGEKATLSTAERRIVTAYNRLDEELYRRIRVLPSGRLLRPERLPSGTA